MSHWIESYIGIPWRTGGRDPAVGLDCWGMLAFVYNAEFGIDLPLYAVPPGTVAEKCMVLSNEMASGHWIPVNEPQEGDGVAMAQGTEFSHVGVYVTLRGEAAVIHTSRHALSGVITLRELREKGGWNRVAFYRHADRLASH